MTTVSYSSIGTPLRERLAYHVRVLKMIARVEFRLKYLDSVLGYFWSLAKPLSYFAIIWALLGGVFKGGIAVERYPLFLLMGLVLYGYTVEGIGMAMASIVTRVGLLRRVAFPRIVVPIAATATASLTFLINSTAVIAFIAISGIAPRIEWLLIPPLLLELYVVILGAGLLLATLYVRFRDVGQLWELASQLLLFAMPVMYAITILPPWAQKLLLLNPAAQVMQDVRFVILGSSRAPETIAGVYGSGEWRLVPIALAVGLLVLGLLVFQRQSPYFAEKG